MPDYVTGSAWKATHPSNGRPRGSHNTLKYEAKEFAREVLNSEAYRENLRQRAIEGTLSPQMEALLWHHAYGRPIEQLQIQHSTIGEDLSVLTTTELAERARRTAEELAELAAQEATIDAEWQRDQAERIVTERSSTGQITPFPRTVSRDRQNEPLRPDDAEHPGENSV